jgi:hypothetical protein
MVDFFALSSSSKTVKSIRFHLPLVLETPETQVIVSGMDMVCFFTFCVFFI